MSERLPINVGLVIDTLARGGAERVLVSLANELDPARFRVHVITTRRGGELADQLKPHVTVHSLERRSRWDAGALFRFARIVDRQGIEILHTHNHTASYFARLARPLCRRKWLHVMHDHHGPVETSNALRFVDRVLLRKLDYYIGVSPRLVSYASHHLRIPDDRCEYVENGISIPAATQKGASGNFTVLQLGRLRSDKNQLMGIRVADRLRRQVPGLRWLIVGGMQSTYAKRCLDEVQRRQLSQTVRFLGEHGDVTPFLKIADLGVLTSSSEGLPLALLEYMASGLPVVVTDVGACKKIVEAGAAGAVVEPHDEEMFAGAVAELAKDKAYRSSCGRRGYDFVQSRFSSDRMARKVMRIYESLLHLDDAAALSEHRRENYQPADEGCLQ